MSWKDSIKPIEAAPSTDDTSASSWRSTIKNHDESGLGQDIGDALKGLGQGATLGFGDELLGGAEALKDLITDPTAHLQDLLDRYRKHQKENEKAYEEARERSPWLTTGGELVGGLALPGGAALNAGKELGIAGKLALGAGIGATAGAGGSTGSLKEGERGQLAQDIGIGSVMGAGAEGAGMAVGKGISKAKETAENLAKEYDFIKQLGIARERGLDRKGFISNSDKNEITKGTTSLSEDIAKRLDEGTGQYAKEQYKSGINSINRNIVLSDENLEPLSNFSESLNKYINKEVPTFEVINAKAIKENIDKAINGEMSPQELKKLTVFLREKFKDPTKSAFYGSAHDAIRAIEKNNFELLGETYPHINKTYRQDKELKEALTSDIPESIRTRQIGDSHNPEELIYNKTKDIINNSGRDYSDAKKGLNRLNQFADKIEELRSGRKAGMEGPMTGTGLKPVGEGPILQNDNIFNHNIANPNLLDAGGLDDALVARIRKQADLEGTLHKMQGTEFTSDSPLFSFNTGKRSLLYTTNFAAQGEGFLRDVGQKFYSAPKEHLLNISATLKVSPKTAWMGQALENAANNPGSVSKNAIMFSIMQHPEARQQVANILGVKGDGK